MFIRNRAERVGSAFSDDAAEISPSPSATAHTSATSPAAIRVESPDHLPHPQYRPDVFIVFSSTPILCWILDDCSLSRQLVAARFTQAGHRVETFSDARDLLTHLKRSTDRASLLITDEQMPISRGQDLLEAAHALGFLGSRVLMSASPELITPTRFADFIIAKPVTPAVVAMLAAHAASKKAA
jgi:CheY-like chemotaxis protein